MLTCPQCKSPLNKAKALRRRYGAAVEPPTVQTSAWLRERTEYEHGRCACGRGLLFVTTTDLDTGVVTETKVS